MSPQAASSSDSDQDSDEDIVSNDIVSDETVQTAVITEDPTDDDFTDFDDDAETTNDTSHTSDVDHAAQVEDQEVALEESMAPAMPAASDPYLPPDLVEPVVPVAAPLPAHKTPSPTWRDRRAASRLRARKVRRLIRHIEPWSMLKISLLFYFCLWIILLVAGVLLWGAAVNSGTVDNIENFIRELFALDTFEFDADKIFRSSALGGLVMVVAATGFNVLLAVLFNLISDLTGGVRITVVEEESARMFARPAKRTRKERKDN